LFTGRVTRSRTCISLSTCGTVSYHAIPTGGWLTHSLPSGSHK
jgi:hypothetical protein